MDVHRHFLLTRDYTAIAFLMLVAAGPLGLWLLTSALTAAAYIGLLLLQYFLAQRSIDLRRAFRHFRFSSQRLLANENSDLRRGTRRLRSRDG